MHDHGLKLTFRDGLIFSHGHCLKLVFSHWHCLQLIFSHGHCLELALDYELLLQHELLLPHADSLLLMHELLNSDGHSLFISDWHGLCHNLALSLIDTLLLHHAECLADPHRYKQRSPVELLERHSHCKLLSDPLIFSDGEPHIDADSNTHQIRDALLHALHDGLVVWHAQPVCYAEYNRHFK